MLQEEVRGAEGLSALVDAMRAAPQQRATYEAYLTLVSRLTNPTSAPDLRPLLVAGGPAGGRASFFPPSVSHETGLVTKLYGDRPIPEGFSLVEEMIRRIRTGELRLQPTGESGWYDYQAWAHEALVIPERMPEATKLRFDESYRKELVELFKGAQALARETHVKQLEVVEATGLFRQKEPLILRVGPGLTVEPLASLYLRRALGYRFVRGVFEAFFGPDGLTTLSRVTPDGPVPGDLGSQLEEMESLLWGAYLTTCREIGLAPDASLAAEAREERHARRFAGWAAALEADPDLGRDMRMMVPLFYDIQRRRIKVWVFLGWVTRDGLVEFEKPPRAEVYDADGRPVRLDHVWVEFHGERHTLAYPVSAEVYVSCLLDLVEFRRICDTYKTRSAILDRLE